MSTWVYFAARTLANQADTIRFAMIQNVVWSSARDSRGNLIANVGNLQPGDTLLLVYRQPGPRVVRVAAKIAGVANPVHGTKVIERVEPPHSQFLLDADYRPVNDSGAVEVIHLEDVTECEILLHGAYAGQTTIRELAREDARVVAQLPLSEDSLDQQEVSQEAAASAFEAEESEATGSPVIPVEEPATVASEFLAIRRPDAAGAPLFDAYVMVDWSSRRVPVHGANSIWVAWGYWEAGELIEGHENKATRASALGFIRNELLGGIFASKRVLLGFDFAFGYPRGFAAALGLKGLPWRAVLERFRVAVQDSPNNAHNRDAFAGECNAQIAGGGPGPFWGCTGGAVGPNLTTRRVGVFDFPYAGLDEYRETERQARCLSQPQSVWKLNQGIAVGGQTILGIKYLAELRFGGDAALRDRIAIWPFETGWGVPAGPNTVVLAEIFPSVLPIEDDLAGLVRDLAQVRTCVREAASKDALGQLVSRFAAPVRLTDAQRETAKSEEGWILFVP